MCNSFAPPCLTLLVWCTQASYNASVALWSLVWRVVGPPTTARQARRDRVRPGARVGGVLRPA